MNGQRNKNPKNVIVFIVLIGIIFSLYFYLNNNKQEDAVKTKTEAEKLLEKDLTNDYPATPTSVVKLSNRISKCLYNDKLNNEQVNELIVMIRKLYSKELLENNPEEKYNKTFKSDIADYQDKKKSIMTYRVDGNNQVDNWEKDGVEYASLNTVYSVAEKKDHYKIYQNFILNKENSQWKIVGWTGIPETEIEE